jgi:hypothetical protein
MANPLSFIGTVVQVSVATPATVDASGFNALTWTTINKIVQWGEVGDQSNDIGIECLDGRTEHVNGGKDGGEIPWTFRTDTGDAGQAILRNNSNNNTTLSFKITDPDGTIAYYFGLCANARDIERTSSNYKGMTGVIRVNSATIRA